MSPRVNFFTITLLTVTILVTGGFACKRRTTTTGNENANVTANVQTNESVNALVNAGNANAAVVDENTRIKQELGQLAMSFAERFGSYSNQNNFENIVDLKPFMSKRMQAWADQFVAAGRANPADTSIYYGITTRALTSDVKRFDPQGPVEFVITTQRREATGTTSNAKVSNQDISLIFVREDGVWRVDEARWQ